MSGDVREIPRLHSRDLSGQAKVRKREFERTISVRIGREEFFMNHEQSGKNTETDRAG